MVRITSSSMGRGLALMLLIALGGMTPLEAQTEKDEAGRSQEASPAKGEASEPAARDRCARTTPEGAATPTSPPIPTAQA